MCMYVCNVYVYIYIYIYIYIYLCVYVLRMYVATSRKLFPAHAVSLSVSMFLPVNMDSFPVQH